MSICTGGSAGRVSRLINHFATRIQSMQAVVLSTEHVAETDKRHRSAARRAVARRLCRRPRAQHPTIAPPQALLQSFNLYDRLLGAWGGPPTWAVLFLCFATAAQAQTTDSTVLISKNALDKPIEYGARDSMWVEAATQVVHLYGEGFVKMEGMSLTADHITINLKTKVAEARAATDSTGVVTGKPHFEQGDQIFDAMRLAYNFETRKGIIYDITTTQGDLYVRGAKSKFFGAAADDTLTKHTAYSQNAFFTTCNDDHPHFGIRSWKQKVVANSLIVVGPSQLEIGGVPTPFLLPFGFFPITKSKRHGILTPQDVTYAADMNSYGLRGLGYYVPLGDHFAFTTRNDLYWNGSYNLGGDLSYLKRYRYNGSMQVGYSVFRRENPTTTRFEPQKSYSVRWTFNQDQRAHPTFRFNANVNVQSNNYLARNRNDAQSVLTNALSSNISFNKSFPGRPYTLNGGLNQSQNVTTREVVLNFPNLNFQMQRVFPFKRAMPVGNERWYEKISFRYESGLRSKVVAADTALFAADTWQRATYGINHVASTDASYRVLKYFNIQPSVNYRESWYFRTVGYNFTEGLQTLVSADTLFGPDQSILDITQRVDTIARGTIDTLMQSGFSPLRLFNASVSANTQIFGTVRLKSGPVRGLRHTVKPSASLTFGPDYQRRPFNYFDTVVVIRPNGRLDTVSYTRFQAGAGLLEQVPTGRRSMALNVSINNIFEAKVRGRRDTLDRKVKLLDNLIVNGGYNFAADSLKWNNVRVGGTLRFFKGLTVMSGSADWDPYMKDPLTNRSYNTLVWTETGRPLRFEQVRFDFNTGLTVRQLRDALAGKEPQNQPDTRGNPQTGKPAPSLGDLFDNFRIAHTLSVQYFDFKGRDTLLFVNTVNFRGSIELTDNWSFDIGNIGYDFKNRSFTYPDITLYRNLHCWEMGTSWQPTRGTYTFFLRVKTGSLDFLRVPYNKPFPDQFDF